MDLETLLAKQEIGDVIYRYARGIDRLDFDLVRSCYHPDAVDDHGAFKGNVDEFIEMCREFLPRWTATMHFMGNVLIDEIDGTAARAETYAVAYHRREATENSEGKDDVFGIRYVDRFEKREGRWRIAHRIVATEWRRVDPVKAKNSRGAVGAWGTRDGNDVIDWIMDAQATVA
ncbi:MAG TPA: nuclear transport factor 2 family protein [Acidimicrobiaceae bacterium]|nr:nuclear transport factor 2 family protein [Acidimicrobiaceae bacterium]